MKKNYEKNVRQILNGLCLFGLIGFSTLSAQEWQPITPPNSPDARQGHSMVTLPDGRVFLFGGEDAQDVLMNDLSELDSYAWNAITPNNSPPPIRKDHQAWARDDLMYIYGGYGENGALDDMWSYNSTTNIWQEEQISGPRPSARHGHATKTLTDGSEIIVGGTGADGEALKDCWRLNPDNTFTQLQDAPYAYTGHSLELGPDGEWLYVFGKPGSLGIYRVSTDRWSLVSGGPPNGKGCMTRQGTNSAGEPVVFIFGGKDINGNEMSETYQYNLYGGELTQRGDMPQPIVNGSATKIMANPPTVAFPGLKNKTGLNSSQDFDQTTLVFGGLSNGVVTNNTYLFSPQTPPEIITIIATADTIKSDTVELFWNPASPIPATNYEAQLYLDSSANTLFADTVLSDTTVRISGLKPQTNYYWRVCGYNAGGWGENSIMLHFYTEFVVGIEENEIPQSIALHQNYPNPFTQSTIIEYNISEVGNTHFPAVQLTIYNLFGSKITTIVNEEQSPGNYKINYDASKLPNGVYYYNLQVGNFVQTKRMLLYR